MPDDRHSSPTVPLQRAPRIVWQWLRELARLIFQVLDTAEFILIAVLLLLGAGWLVATCARAVGA